MIDTSTLIEGGQRLSGAVDVEGNKNAALPLLAACLLTTEECVLTNVPRISDVEVMARLLLDLGARGRGHRQHDAARALPGGRQGRARRRAGRPAARIGAAARAAAGAARPRAPGAARRRFSGAAHDRHAPRGARGDGRAQSRRRCRPRARGAGRPEADVDLSVRSVGDRHRDGAARGGRRRRASRKSATPPASRTSSSCASFSRSSASASRGAGTTTIRIEGGGKLRGAEHRLWGDYIEAGSWAVVAAVTGGEIEVRGARAEDMEVVAAVLKRMNIAVRDGRRRLPRRAVARRGRPAASRPACGPGFPSDLVSLVTVLATQAEGRTLVHDWLYELRLFALEQLSGMSARSVPLRSAPHHRHRPAAAARPAARQPRSAIGHGADRGREIADLLRHGAAAGIRGAPLFPQFAGAQPCCAPGSH